MLNSVDMTVSLPTRKVDNLIRKCKHVLNAVRLTIRELAELIGILVSSFTAVEFGRLHYRHLEAVKVQALKASAGNFDATVVISPEAKKEVFGGLIRSKRRCVILIMESLPFVLLWTHRH